MLKKVEKEGVTVEMDSWLYLSLFEKLRVLRVGDELKVVAQKDGQQEVLRVEGVRLLGWAYLVVCLSALEDNWPGVSDTVPEWLRVGCSEIHEKLLSMPSPWRIEDWSLKTWIRLNGLVVLWERQVVRPGVESRTLRVCATEGVEAFLSLSLGQWVFNTDPLFERHVAFFKEQGWELPQFGLIAK